MARTRHIKPGFFLNEDLAELDPLCRILFIGLWTIADREGKLKDKPRRIKAAILPYDECDVDEYLNQLHERGFILRYKVCEDSNTSMRGLRYKDGTSTVQVCEDSTSGYILIRKFYRHQHPHKNEPKAEIPDPDWSQKNSNASTVQVYEDSGKCREGSNTNREDTKIQRYKDKRYKDTPSDKDTVSESATTSGERVKKGAESKPDFKFLIQKTLLDQNLLSQETFDVAAELLQLVDGQQAVESLNDLAQQAEDQEQLREYISELVESLKEEKEEVKK